MSDPSGDLRSTKTVLVTGATGAIGLAIAERMAHLDGYAVVLIARNLQKAEQAVQRIRQASGNSQVSYEIVDLSQKKSIQALAERWQASLDVLVNNAAVTPRGRQETPEGIELQFATNVLGYLWMAQAFTPHLGRAAPARVVNVASYWAGDLDLDDLEFRQRRYDNGIAYRQSKQANRMLTAALAGRLAEARITVNACHPGDVNSKLSNDLGFGGFESPYEGADTPVWLATSPEVMEKTGAYFEHRRQVFDRFVQDQAAVERLYRICSAY